MTLCRVFGSGEGETKEVVARYCQKWWGWFVTGGTIVVDQRGGKDARRGSVEYQGGLRSPWERGRVRYGSGSVSDGLCRAKEKEAEGCREEERRGVETTRMQTRAWQSRPELCAFENGYKNVLSVLDVF